MPPPKVTVLMAVYNGARYLPQALESVLHQTFTDFELLIMDDGSQDDSVACIRGFTDPRIRLVVNERNIGQAGSLNRGLAQSPGTYIARLDQDDLCLPDRLKQQVAFLDMQPDVACVGTWQYWIDPEGRRLGLETGVVDLRRNDFGTFLGILLTQATPIGHPTVMFRREAVIQVGGYDETFAPCEDYELWCRLALRRYGMGVIPRPLVMWRIHEGQQSVKRFRLQQDCARRAHERLVRAFCSGEEARWVGMLLRMEDPFWHEKTSVKEVRVVLQELRGMLEAVRRTLRLTQKEYGSLKHRVYGWLGRGAFVNILKQRRQTLPLFLESWRGGIRLLFSPAILAYPACLLLSPLFRPSVRRFLTSGLGVMRRLRLLYRLGMDRLKERRVPQEPEPRVRVSMEHLSRALEEIRKNFPDGPILAIPWIHPKHPIHPSLQELIEEEALSGDSSARTRPPRIFSTWLKMGLCLLYATYLAARILQLRVRLRREIKTLKGQPFDLVAKTWCARISSTNGVDFYYGDLQNRLQGRHLRMLFLMGDSSGKSWHTLSEDGVSTTFPWRLPELCLVPLVAPFQMALQQMGSAVRLERFALKAQDPLVRRLALRASRWALSRQITPLGLYHWIGKRAIQIWNPKAFVTLYEGQPWEMLVWRGVKAANPQCQIVGYQHTVVMPHSSSVLSPTLHSKGFLAPDIVLCLGEISRGMMAPGHALGKNRLVVFGSFRRGSNRIGSSLPEPQRRTVLVVPETGVIQEAKLLFNFAIQAASLLPDYRFIFRCHPLYPFEGVRPHLADAPERYPNIEISQKGSIEEDFARSSLLLYRGSSTVLYAILHGLKPIYLKDDHPLCVDPLFQLSGWREQVSSSREMEQVLRGYESALPDEELRQWRKAFAYADAYTVPVDGGSMDRFLEAAGLSNGRVAT